MDVVFPLALLGVAPAAALLGPLLTTVGVVVNPVLWVLLVLKCWAYGVETRWLFGGGGKKLRNSYMASYHSGRLPRTYHDDLDCDRPRPFTKRSDKDSTRKNLWTLFGYVFKTPSLILVAFLSIFVSGRTPGWIDAVTAFLVTLLVLLMLVTALAHRLVLGPFDQFNPDLNVSRAISDRIYPGSSSLGRYLLVLIVSALLGFTVVYADLSHGVSGAFSVGHSSDPILWLYFTATIASTAGFGDVHATSDVGRLVVLTQMGVGSLLLTWIAAVFVGEQLPEPDAAWEPGDHHRSGESQRSGANEGEAADG